MRKFAIVLLLLLTQISLGQTGDKFTLTFKAVPRSAAIEKIEAVSGYRFYFDPSWIESGQDLLTAEFVDTDISVILESVFANTEVNYYIDGKRIILTRNSNIRKLPDDFFEGADSEITSAPVFRPSADSTSAGNADILFIGKESMNSFKRTHRISGQVINRENGETLSDIVIQIGSISATTDAAGRFAVELPGGLHEIETQSAIHEGYHQKIMVYGDGRIPIRLSERPNELDEVVVDANKDQNVRSAISGVVTLESEGIKNIPLILGERDVLRAATAIPGIKTAGEGSAGYNVRGGKEDQNLFLLDHGLLYNPAHFFGFFSALNPFTTKKVDIYKGSIPAEFGGRLSSVFDITTKTGNYDQVAGEGGIGPVTSNLSISFPIAKGKSSIIVGGRATYSDWILKSLDEESLKNSSASFYDAIVKYSHKINENNLIESTVYYSRDAFNISSDSLFKYSNRLISVKWDHSFNEKSKGALIVTNSEYTFNIDYDSDNVNAFDFGYKLNETQVIAKMNYQFNKSHKFNFGLSSKLYGIRPGYLNPKNSESLLVPIDIEKEKALESAAFFSDSYKVSEKFQIEAGLRYSFYAALGKSTQRVYESGLPLNDATVVDEKTFGSNEIIKTYGGLEPRLALRYIVFPSFSIKAGYDKTFQYIHLLSSNTTQSPTDSWKLSDLNVQPQRSEQFSLGAYKNFGNDVWELSVEGYYKRSKNILDYKVAATLLLADNIETQLLQGEGKAYGAEIMLKKTTGRLNGWLGYTYARSLVKLDSRFNEERVNNGNFFPANFDKPHDVSAVLNYKFTKRYSFSANFIYQTGRPITYPIGTYEYNGAQYTLYSDRNQFRIPDYYRLDLGINIEGNHKIKKLAHSFWNISVYNVLGRNNPYSVYFVTENGEVKGYKTSIFAIPVPTITYNFKF